MKDEQEEQVLDRMERAYKEWVRRTRDLNKCAAAKEKSAFCEGFMQGRVQGFDEGFDLGVKSSDLEGLGEE